MLSLQSPDCDVDFEERALHIKYLKGALSTLSEVALCFLTFDRGNLEKPRPRLALAFCRAGGVDAAAAALNSRLSFVAATAEGRLTRAELATVERGTMLLLLAGRRRQACGRPTLPSSLSRVLRRVRPSYGPQSALFLWL